MTAQRHSKPKTRVKIARTQSELGAALGVTQKAVSKWTRHPAWEWSSRGPFDVEAVRAWTLSNLSADVTNPERQTGGERSERLKLTIARRKKIELETAVIQSKHIPRAVVQAEWDKATEEAKAALLAIPRGVASTLVGLSSEDIEEYLTRRITEVLHQLAGAPNYERDS